MQGHSEDADAPCRVLYYGEDIGLGAAGQAGREEVANCDQAGPVRRGAGSIPAFSRISHAVDAASFTPGPASSPWILR
jgi:hypothetical protein